MANGPQGYTAMERVDQLERDVRELRMQNVTLARALADQAVSLATLIASLGGSDALPGESPLAPERVRSGKVKAN